MKFIFNSFLQKILQDVVKKLLDIRLNFKIILKKIDFIIINLNLV